MWAAITVLTVFLGLCGLVLTVSGVILVAVGRVTLPGTAERKIREAEAEMLITQQKRLTLLEQEKIDLMFEERYKQLNPGSD